MDVSVDPVPQVLRPSGFGAGVTAGAQHRDGHLGLANFARPWAVTEPSAGRDPGTSFPGTILMPKSHVQLALPSAGKVAVPTGGIAPWMSLFLPLPQQMKGCVLLALQLPVNRRPVWQAPLIPRRSRWWRKQTPLPSNLIQIGWPWATQPRRFQTLRIAPPVPALTHHLRLHSMWATIPVESKCRPHPTGITGSHRMESPDRFHRNRWTTLTGIGMKGCRRLALQDK